MRVYNVHYRAELRWEKGINMPQKYQRDVFHLRNDLRTTFAILKSSPSTCEMTFYILHFERTIYSWIQYLDLKGKNEVERKIVFLGIQPESSTWQKRECRGCTLGPVERAGWNVIIWRILDICIILHETPSASDLRERGGKALFFSFLKSILSQFLASPALGFGAGSDGRRCSWGEKVTDFQKVRDAFFFSSKEYHFSLILF